MNKFVKFFHELINPHCEHCASDNLQKLEQLEMERANDVCQSCENTKMQLAFMQQLVNKLTDKEKPEVAPVIETPHTVIRPNTIPWSVMQKKLEAESRLKAAQLQAEASVKIPQPDVVEKLEQELGIVNAGNKA